MSPAAAGSALEFDWKEVNCFLRPQALLSEEIGAGQGLLLLCLTSIYRTWGFGGFFAYPRLQHFAFARRIFAPLTGIDFSVTRLRSRDRIPRALERVLGGGGAAILPANVRDFPGGNRAGDQQHYFIVTEVDYAAGLATVRDNLHLGDDGLSTRFETRTLPLNMLTEAGRLYWDTHVDGGRLTPSGEPGFWVLRIRGTHPSAPAEEEVLGRIVAECGRLLAQPRGRSTPFDCRYLRLLREPGTPDQKLVAAYLADANLALVSVRILCHALDRLGRRAAAEELAAAGEAYRTQSGALRMRVLVRVMMGGGLPAGEEERAREGLVAALCELRSALAGGLREGG